MRVAGICAMSPGAGSVGGMAPSPVRAQVTAGQLATEVEQVVAGLPDVLAGVAATPGAQVELVSPQLVQRLAQWAPASGERGGTGAAEGAALWAPGVQAGRRSTSWRRA